MALPRAARAVALRVEAPAWRRTLPGAAKLARRAALAALRGAALRGAALRGAALRGAALGAAAPRGPAIGVRALKAGEIEPASLPAGGLCLVLADDALQRRLNREFRGRDKPTNVLSFDGAPAALGDVVLALETIAAEAQAQGKPLADHLAHLVVHGVLHLLGYDHKTEGQARSMERLEIEILAGLGIGDPYHLRPAGMTAKRKSPPGRQPR